LTHYADALKRKILQDLLKCSDQFFLHEITLRGPIDDSEKAKRVSREVGSALAIGFHPSLTVPGWKKNLYEYGYKITNLDMLEDEGPTVVAKIARNLTTHKDQRERVVSTKVVTESHKDILGYIALRAIKK
jgi:hypothetical protein